MDLSLRLEAGMVHISDEPQVPFGGVKNSGFGREGGRHSPEELSEVKWIAVQLGQPQFPFWRGGRAGKMRLFRRARAAEFAEADPCDLGSLSSPLRRNISYSQPTQITSLIPAVPSHFEGRLAIVTDAGRDAVDADVSITNDMEADGQIVWS